MKRILLLWLFPILTWGVSCKPKKADSNPTAFVSDFKRSIPVLDQIERGETISVCISFYGDSFNDYISEQAIEKQLFRTIVWNALAAASQKWQRAMRNVPDWSEVSIILRDDSDSDSFVPCSQYRKNLGLNVFIYSADAVGGSDAGKNDIGLAIAQWIGTRQMFSATRKIDKRLVEQVILHEFGHIIGLEDTYSSVRLGDRGPQPASVMLGGDAIVAGTFPDEPNKDDILSLRLLADVRASRPLKCPKEEGYIQHFTQSRSFACVKESNFQAPSK